MRTKAKDLIHKIFFTGFLIALSVLFQISCSDDENGPIDIPDDTVEEPEGVDTAFLKDFLDTYYHVYQFEKVYQWGVYNTHDPSVIYHDGYYYCYSTDVFYGLPIMRAGIQVRRSGDLVKWDFLEWAYSGRPSQAVAYITENNGTPVDNVWAPYILKAGDQFRLYYSQAAVEPKLSAIGLTTSNSPMGPWTEAGLVVTSKSSITMPNAIDPTVIIDQQQRHFMFYGSSWDGIYILQLDPATGLALTPNSKGKRIAHRGFTNNVMNGNIEAPEVIYNPQFNKYYLFISYDWLETKYNVRVCRADNAEGPYYDYNGNDVNTYLDNGPMILAPYAFSGHSGWQGTAHCAVFEKDGQYYMAHQGRPVINKSFMDLHVRRILWTDDGWPVVSPQRYAGISVSEVNKEELTGSWERIEFGYRVVPGFAEEQTSPDLQKSAVITLAADSTINGDASYKWSFTGQTLELNWNNVTIDKVLVERGWDWEKKTETILFTGLNNKGTTIWGKKVQ
ncbi:MAG: arabinan endo-1,5-alpha-L-arabinosidase [Bacteroidales bacterium]|nr:arabinan endo-1,5-alpha-L-arabinosidase [Bacteroidales bacterium]